MQSNTYILGIADCWVLSFFFTMDTIHNAVVIPCLDNDGATAGGLNDTFAHFHDYTVRFN